MVASACITGYVRDPPIISLLRYCLHSPHSCQCSLCSGFGTARAKYSHNGNSTQNGFKRAVETDGPRHTVPGEIMNSSTPLHCLERDIIERVHTKVQREIGEHDETSCEAKPPDRHLVAENARIYHLTPSPGRDAASYHSASVVWKGEG